MQKLVTVLAVLMALSAMTAFAETPPDLSVLPAKFRCVVLYPDGETPVSRLRVNVWDAESETVVYKTRTTKDGVFEIPELKEGSQYVTVGPVRIDMRILTCRAGVTPQPHGLVIVVPKRMPTINILVPGLTGAGLVPQIMSP